MAEATHPLSQKIAIAFDFDDTLVPDSFDALLEYIGIDAARFRQEKYQPLREQGWDGIPARFYSLVRESRSRQPDEKITQELIAEFGQQLQPFEGVPEMFGRLRQRAEAIVPEIELEFYLITSGFAEVARYSCIAENFTAIWGCEFHYSESGEVEFLKRSVSHPEKTRFLYYLSKGINDQAGEPAENDFLFVYEDIPPEQLAIPLTQVIYVGDGTSDIPCFAMLNQEGGTSIGVYPSGTAQDWADNYDISRGERVANLAPATYAADSELMRSLTYAVESLCKKIQLRQFSLHE